MRLLIQRVTSGKVTIEHTVVGQIGKGYVILFGAKDGDTPEDVSALATRVSTLRIMSDKEDKMNRSIVDIDGEILVVSQFTLYADMKGGRRPSFIHAAKPDVAQRLYVQFIEELKQRGIKNVQTGKFGGYMNVEIQNDGPVTILLDTEELGK